jgi:hypothetical protein
MSRANIFMEKATKFLEASQKSFHLKKPIMGWGFSENIKKTIPAGDYVTVEPDDRDQTRMIIAKKKSYEMYAISKRDIPA